MRKVKLAVLVSSVFVLVLALTIPVSAGMLIPVSEKAKEKSKGIENSPVISQVAEGLVINTPGLDRIVYIHYKKGFAKPPWAGGGKDKNGSKCYGFLVNGAKWKDLPQDLVIDPDYSGLSQTNVVSAITAGAEEWAGNTSADLYGDYSVVNDASWDDTVPDGRNELLFGNYSEPGVIGVTIAWGYFSGPPKTREIVEFDILFDTDYTWGDATIDSSVMDLQNIATHELGHGFGLGDLYELSCSEETMYGYSDYGETQKRDLNSGDIIGIQKLYGM